LEIGGFAASAGNEQPWRWLVVTEPAEVQRIAAMVVDWMRIIMKNNPANATRAGFPRIVSAWDSGKDRVCRGAPHVIVAHAEESWPYAPEDCANALTYIDLYAQVLGLGTCWAGYLYTAVNNYFPLFDALNIPAHHRACGAMMVGYSVYTYHRCPPRKEPQATWK
jgi:nitroreductase